uniref:Uncharacterized protein n=1 Tax=Bombyx mori TaxID=7091 RepID=A0A8R2HQC7_BOMMO|nr:uncharacterized protein LOC110385397 isoform X2 [Bombyx mori]XP_021204340.1 uncharacterized protein LOC110385397 isoform X2 [Bombyx mori]
MIELPKIERNVNNTQDLCKCRPICKSRRREWKGQVQQTSAELLLESKPKVDCLRKWPAHYAQSKCVVRSADAGPVVHAPQASMHPGTPRGPTSDCLTCAVLTCASKPIACKCVSCIIKKMNYYFTSQQVYFYKAALLIKAISSKQLFYLL